MGDYFPMKGGNGAYSYTKNSEFQKEASDSVKAVIQEAITEKLDAEILVSISNTLRIADFGCSVGPNTFFAMQNLIEATEKKCYLQGRDLEFQVFFNDHTANDFNTLFATLPQDRKYHAAGVPGSFYGRLFPRASISLAYSSYALQWLSKVPEEISNSISPAWNQGRIHYAGASNEVKRAYSDQFERDMGVFISARADEIVSGGLMFLIIPVLPEGGISHHTACVLFYFLGSCLTELANEGVIDKSKIDAFNLPIYFPTVEQMTTLIEKHGCFSIERIELTYPRQIFGDSMVIHQRASVGGVFTKQFGASVEEKLFAKYLAKAEEMTQFLEAGNHITTQLLLALKRK